MKVIGLPASRMVSSFNFLVIWTPGLDKEPQERFVGFFPRLRRYLEDYRVW